MTRSAYAAAALLLSLVFLVGFQSPGAQQFKPGDTAQIIGRVNVREEPSTHSPVVALLQDGEIVTIVDFAPTGQVVTIEGVTSSLWYLVRLADGKTGYVWFGLLEPVEVTLTPTISPSPSLTPSSFVQTTLAALNIPANSGYVDGSIDDLTLDLSGIGEGEATELIGAAQRNFVLHADIAWGWGDESDACGFRFREGVFASSFYQLDIDRNGWLTMTGQNWGFWWDYYLYGNGDLINTSRSSTNELTLIALDDQFTVYLNGELAGQFQHDQLERGNTSLLATSWEKNDDAGCTFRNVWLWSLTEDVAPQPTITPQPTPTLVPEVESELARIGIPLSEGQLADELNSYRIDLTNDDDLVRTYRLDPVLTDFVVGTTFQWGPGATDDECGLQFRRMDDDNYYTLRLDRDGAIRFKALIDDDWGDPLRLENGTLIKTGAEDQNSVVVVGQGSTFTVFINGQFADRFTDDQLSEGFVGVMASTGTNSREAYCDFDYTWAWQLEPQMASIPIPTPIPTHTSTPYPTPAPEMSQALATIGLSTDSGFLAERLPEREFVFRGGGEAADNIDFSGMYDNFAIGTTVQWGPEPEDNRCGVYFREQGAGNGYFLMLLPDQNLNFAVTGQLKILDTDRAFSDLLRTEPNSVNTLMVVVVDQVFNVYVNGQFATRFQDNTYASGEAGVTAASLAAEGGISCRFSDTWLWQFTGAVTLPPTPTPVAQVATPLPIIADRLTQVGVDPSNGELAFQRDSISIGPLTSKPDQSVNQDFSGRYENFVLGMDVLWGPGGEADLCGAYFGSRGAGELRAVMLNQWQQLILGTTRLGITGGNNLTETRHAIRVGPDAVNQLILVVDHQTFDVYLNGEHVAQLRDETYQGGIVGVSATRRSYNFASGCEFRDIWLWELQEPLPPIPSPTPIPDVVPPFIVEALSSAGVSPDDGALDVYLTQYGLHQSSSADSPVFIGEIATDYYNFVLGTDFTWEPSESTDSCGVIFRHDQGDLYALSFEQDGIYYYLGINGEAQPLIWLSDLTPSTEQANSLMLVGVDDTFSLYLNGQYLAQFQDESYAFGMVALLAKNAPDADQLTCTYANTWIYDLKEGGPAVPSPTPAPSPTPMSDVVDTLHTLGVSPNSGYIAETIDRVILDLTGRNNDVEAQWLGSYENFILASSFLWGPGNELDVCGIAFRTREGGDYYQVSVNQKQRINVSTLAEGRLTDRVYYDTPAIQVGEGEENELWLVVAGDTLTIYINEQYAAQYRGLDVAEGELFLVADTGTRSEETFCIFEDTWVWDLAYEVPVILTPTFTPSPSPTPTATPSPTPTLTPLPPDI